MLFMIIIVIIVIVESCCFFIYLISYTCFLHIIHIAKGFLHEKQPTI